MRGFAQTAYCPRCETPHATGLDIAPILTCTRCGLGFDPTREPVERVDRPEAPEAAIVLPPEIRELAGGTAVEFVGDTDAMLRVHESGGGVLLLLATVLALLGVYVLPGEDLDLFAPVAIGLAALSAYAGLSRVLGDIVIYVSADTLSSRQRPLPRRSARTLTGDIASLSIVNRHEWPGDRVVVYAIEAGGERRAIEIASVAWYPNDIARWIRTQRARLGAPIRDAD